MTQETPAKNRGPWSWRQFGISLCLIASGLLAFYLGVNAGFGGKTGIARLDSLVGNGEACYGIGPLISLVGVIWTAALLVRRFLKRFLE